MDTWEWRNTGKWSWQTGQRRDKKSPFWSVVDVRCSVGKEVIGTQLRQEHLCRWKTH